MMKKIGIVGQGIAGTMLARSLMRQGAEVMVADNGHQYSSSIVAAGIINPVTGKRYALSWRFPEFYAAARSIYREMENELHISIWQEHNIVRALGSPLESNNWAARCALPEFEHWIGMQPDAGVWQGLIRPADAYGVITGAARANFFTLLPAFRKWLLEKDALVETRADAADIADATFADCDHVVFCEGYRVRSNPWFGGLPWQHAKGDVLIIRLLHPDAEKVYHFLKKNIMVAPLGNGLLWAGANYAWEFPDHLPTESGRDFILNELNEMLTCPYEVVEHLAGVRPVLKDRRPVLGLLPDHPRLGVFNGLGAKGALLAPYWAEQMAGHLLEGLELPAEVSLSRFL